MGLKPDEQNEKQPPGEGSKRADRLGFIVLVQAHYWQGQSACGEATLRNLTAENGGHKTPASRPAAWHQSRLAG
jgi:hypothetical protein